MRLLLGEDSQGRIFLRQYQAAGHDMETVSGAGLNGRPDQDVFDYANASARVILTRNTSDLLALHDADNDHFGILAEYQDDDLAKNMRIGQIVAAIVKIEASGWNLAGELFSINAWR